MHAQDTTEKYETAISYFRNGLYIIPVHGITPDEHCTCPAGPQCGRNAGKHPIEKGWQNSNYSIADLYTIFVEKYPYANIGAITGERTRLLAIDIDPDNGGDVTWRKLLDENGPISETYNQGTGSGGDHFLFNHPPFRIKGDKDGKVFGPGIDIRAHNNMIVMAGSRSGKGLYVPKTGFPILDAPEWMIEKMRSPSVTGEGEVAIIEDLPEYSRLEPYEQERVQKYALFVIEQECTRYIQAPPGRGSAQLFSSACNVLEIAQSPWNTVTLQTARDALERARLKRVDTHQYGGGQTPNEFHSTWKSARSKVAGQGRPYPADPYKTLDFDDEITLPATVSSDEDSVCEFDDPDNDYIEEKENVPTYEDAKKELEEMWEEDKRKTRAREIARAVTKNVIDEFELQEWRELLKSVGTISYGDFKGMVKEAQKERKKTRKVELRKETVRKGEGLELPSPASPAWVAEKLVNMIKSTDSVPHWSWWREDFYRWTGAHWEMMEKPYVRGFVYDKTANAHYMEEDQYGEMVEKTWSPTKAKVDNVIDAMGCWKLQRTGEPDKVIALSDGVLEIGEGLERRELLPHHPRRFNLHSLPFAYDKDAECPQWEQFLDQVLPSDETGKAFLQEWFGYVISGRTDLQKMASLVGAPRSGKGTVSYILESTLGPESVSSPTLGKLGSQFGEQSLIGKRLAVMSDVRWNASDTAAAIPVLLAVTGEDSREIPRKNREDWHGRLPTVFMCMSNDVPTFTDASGAMAQRMIHVRFPISFAGREDHELRDRLLEELPGIFNWALVGLDRLTKRKRFTIPGSSVDIDRDVRALANPVYAFVSERCTLGAGKQTNLVDLYAWFVRWCEESGQKSHTLSRQMVAVKLRSAFPHIYAKPDTRVLTERNGMQKTTEFHGIALGLVQPFQNDM